jgi:hypothetical protein
MLVNADDSRVSAFDGAGDDNDISGEVSLLLGILDQADGSFGRVELGDLSLIDETLSAEVPREDRKSVV